MRGTLADIAARAAQGQLAAPAVLVTGAVAAFDAATLAAALALPEAAQGALA